MKLPQFSLRDLFWLVLVAGMACVWWVDHRRLTVEVRLLRLELEFQAMGDNLDALIRQKVQSDIELEKIRAKAKSIGLER